MSSEALGMTEEMSGQFLTSLGLVNALSEEQKRWHFWYFVTSHIIATRWPSSHIPRLSLITSSQGSMEPGGNYLAQGIIREESCFL